MTPFRGTLVTITAIALAGCASSRQDPWSADRDVTIRVDNRGLAQPATIFLMDNSGVRLRLGRLRSEEVAEFRVTPRPVDYRLVADYGGRTRTTRSFTLSAGERWEWEIALNRLGFARSGRLQSTRGGRFLVARPRGPLPASPESQTELEP